MSWIREGQTHRSAPTISGFDLGVVMNLIWHDGLYVPFHFFNMMYGQLRVGYFALDDAMIFLGYL